MAIAKFLAYAVGQTFLSLSSAAKFTGLMKGS
jgi:hypothetical protein